MNLKHMLPVLMLGTALAVNADGYNDGIEYYKAGQYDNAREILQRNLNAADTDKALAYYYLGQTDLAQDNVASAKTNFDNGIAANPENPYNYVGLGAIDLLNGQQKAAEENFKTAQKYGKKNNEITVDIARAYYNADPVKYEATIEKYLAKAHKDSKNTEPAIYIFEGDRAFDNKDLNTAAAKYEQAITFEEDNPEGYVKFANAYMGVNPMFGVEKLKELVAKQPNSALAQRELAEKYYETSQWTLAADQYGKYIQNPNHFPQDKARYSVLLYANSEYQKSLDIANQLLNTLAKDDQNYFVMNRMRLLDLAELGQNEQAAAAAQQFFALPTNDKMKFNPIDYITYAGVLENLGNNEAALEQYKLAVEADPTRSDNIKTLSNAYSQNGEYQKSAETFNQYIASLENPSLTDYLQASGRWLNAANSAGRIATAAEEAGDEAQAAEYGKLRAESAQEGINAINHILTAEGVTIQPEYYQRAGRLYYAINNKSDANVRNAYLKAIEILDQDPENANPANPKNKLQLYQESYLFVGNSYQEDGDKENRDAAYQKSDYYKAILAGENPDAE